MRASVSTAIWDRVSQITITLCMIFICFDSVQSTYPLFTSPFCKHPLKEKRILPVLSPFYIAWLNLSLASPPKTIQIEFLQSWHHLRESHSQSICSEYSYYPSGGKDKKILTLGQCYYKLRHNYNSSPEYAITNIIRFLLDSRHPYWFESALYKLFTVVNMSVRFLLPVCIRN